MMDMSSDPYARIAPWYERLLSRPLRSFRQAVVGLCRDVAPRRMVDLCCGTGTQVALLRAAGITAFGVDLSAAMLEAAHGTEGSGDVARARCVALPFRDATFDLAMVSLALHEMPPDMADGVVQEAFRVAPLLLLADYRMAERNIDVPATLFMHLPERIAGGEHYRNFRLFMRRGGVEGLVARHGLQVVRRERLWAGAGALVLARRT